MPSPRLCGRLRGSRPPRLAVLAQAQSGAAVRLRPLIRHHLQTRLKSTATAAGHDGARAQRDPESCASSSLLTLAIETSCDDTCVAIVEKRGNAARLLFNERVTADCRMFGGIQPAVAVASHTARLPALVDKALRFLGPVAESGRTFQVRDGPPNGPSLRRRSSPWLDRRVPDFVSVTRGPGIPTALAVGLNLAKGLAVAWQVPLVGVHHMQAHALTPRMVSALANDASASSSSFSSSSSSAAPISPSFPFLTLLVSGGHTLLVRSGSLASHRILARAHNIAIGDCLDKAARAVLPLAWLPAEWVERQPQKSSGSPSPSPSLSQPEPSEGRSFGELLEKFAFPNGPADYVDSYQPPVNRSEELRTLCHRRPGVDMGTYTWTLSPPTGEGKKMEFNFSGFLGAVIAVVQKRTQEEKDMLLGASLSSEAPPAPSSTEPRSPESEASDTENPSQGAPAAPADPSHLAFGDTERRTMAVEVMRLLFENLGSRAIMALQEERRAVRAAATPMTSTTTTATATTTTRTLVVSGGVASNGFLRHVLRSMLDARGFGNVEVVAPPPRFCTDNAAMIAWAGIEVYEEGWTTDGNVLALKDWAVDPDGPDGGILGAPGWIGPGNEEG